MGEQPLTLTINPTPNPTHTICFVSLTPRHCSLATGDVCLAFHMKAVSSLYDCLLPCTTVSSPVRLSPPLYDCLLPCTTVSSPVRLSPPLYDCLLPCTTVSSCPVGLSACLCFAVRLQRGGACLVIPHPPAPGTILTLTLPRPIRAHSKITALGLHLGGVPPPPCPVALTFWRRQRRPSKFWTQTNWRQKRQRKNWPIFQGGGSQGMVSPPPPTTTLEVPSPAQHPMITRSDEGEGRREEAGWSKDGKKRQDGRRGTEKGEETRLPRFKPALLPPLRPPSPVFWAFCIFWKRPFCNLGWPWIMLN